MSWDEVEDHLNKARNELEAIEIPVGLGADDWSKRIKVACNWVADMESDAAWIRSET